MLHFTVLKCYISLSYSCLILFFGCLISLSAGVSFHCLGVSHFIVLVVSFHSLAFLQNTKTTLLHIESRQSRTKTRQFELFLECQGSKDSLVSVTSALRQSPVVEDGCVTVVGEKPAHKKGQFSVCLSFTLKPRS